MKTTNLKIQPGEIQNGKYKSEKYKSEEHSEKYKSVRFTTGQHIPRTGGGRIRRIYRIELPRSVANCILFCYILVYHSLVYYIRYYISIYIYREREISIILYIYIIYFFILYNFTGRKFGRIPESQKHVPCSHSW